MQIPISSATKEIDSPIHTIEGVDAMPFQLREIPQPPSRLFYRGDPSLLYMYAKESGFKLLCVVGSRRYTPYGKEVCERLINGLRGYPIIIVSGLALGIDCIAHKAALDAGLKTIAVPGSGIDERALYPARNRRLAEKIVEAGGCVTSEFNPLEKGRSYFFPQRNRIMAGLSHAVLVVEAEKPSGTLITSRLAQEYNRDVFAVPGSIFSAYSAGPHMLLGKGAAAITCSEDILEALGIEVKQNVSPSEQKDAGPTLFDDTNNTDEFSETEKRLLHLLKTPMTKDQIIVETKMSAAEIGVTISLLEMKGLVTQVGGQFQLTKI